MFQLSIKPRASLDVFTGRSIEIWKVANTTPKNDRPKPNLDKYDQIRDDWWSKNKVAKLLGMFSSDRLYSDWKSVEPVDKSDKISRGKLSLRR